MQLEAGEKKGLVSAVHMEDLGLSLSRQICQLKHNNTDHHTDKVYNNSANYVTKYMT